MKSVQNFGMTTPADASFGPGLASPPGSSIFTTLTILLLTWHFLLFFLRFVRVVVFYLDRSLLALPRYVYTPALSLAKCAKKSLSNSIYMRKRNFSIKILYVLNKHYIMLNLTIYFFANFRYVIWLFDTLRTRNGQSLSLINQCLKGPQLPFQTALKRLSKLGP